MTEQERDALLERNLRSLLSLVGEEPAEAPELDPERAERIARAAEARAQAAERRRGGRWWLVAAGAAAAVILAVSGLHVLGLVPTRYTTIAIINIGSDDRTQRLYDGTVVTAAPGAKAEARGADDARKVRQLIKLESGEIEVNAPKARKGEVACRVETPEGLWVETVGTTFKVTRTYENERGERNVERRKLTGIVTAVLLVAVTEGEVRTGNAVAEEARVAAGGDAVVKAADVPKAGEKIAWGRAVNGLQAGLSVKQVEFGQDRPMEFRVTVRNLGSRELQLADAGWEPGWQTTFCPQDGSAPWALRRVGQRDMHRPASADMTIAAGEEKTVDCAVGGNDFWQFIEAGEAAKRASVRRIPPGKYAMTATYSAANGAGGGRWKGTVIAGPVEVEILAPGHAGGEVSWGQAVGGLQAGLEAKQTKVEAGRPISLAAHLRFAKQTVLSALDCKPAPGAGGMMGDVDYTLATSLRFTSKDGTTWRTLKPAVMVPPVTDVCDSAFHNIEHIVYDKGGTANSQVDIDPAGGWVYEKILQDRPAGRAAQLPPGQYVLKLVYCHRQAACKASGGSPAGCAGWHGTAASGPVEIEIVEPGEAPDEAAGPAEAERIKALIKQLGDADFATREKATQELIAIGRKALPFLQEAAKRSDAEVAERAKRIIAAIPPPAPAFSFAVEKDGFATVTVVAKGLAAEALGREVAKEAAKHIGAEGPSDLRVTIRAAANDSYRAVQSAMLECVKVKVWRVSLEIPGQKPADAPLAKDPGPNGIAQQIRQLDQLIVHVSAADDDPEKPLFRIRLWKSRSPAELAARLKQLRQVGEMPVVIAGDPGCPFKHVMSALDACSEAKIAKVEFLAPQPDSGGSADPGKL